MRAAAAGHTRSMITSWAWAKQEGATRTPRDFEFSRWNAQRPTVVHSARRPELVVEVRYEHMEGDRFRHTAAVQPLAT